MACLEYTTMIECTVELSQDFENNLQQIANLLQSKHLISPSVKDQTLHAMYGLPSTRATKLVTILTNRVEIEPEAFKQIVELLDPRYYSLSLAALRRQYKLNSGKDLPMPMHPPSYSSNPTVIQNGYHHQEPPTDAHQMGFQFHPANQPTHNGYSGVTQTSPVYDISRQAQVNRPIQQNYMNSRNSVHQAPGPMHTQYIEPTQHTSPSQYTHSNGTEFYTARETNAHNGLVVTTSEERVVLDSTPSLEDLLWLEGNGAKVRVIARVAAEWEDLALQLGLERYILRTLKRDHDSKCEDACVNMFQRWLEGEGKGPRTWRTVVKALEGIEDNETALLVRQTLGE